MIRPTPTARLRGIAATLLVAALAAGALFAAPLSANAAPVILSGVVTGPTGVPLPAASVEILAVDADGALASSGTVKSSAAGLFTLPALPAGTYTLRFGATATTFAQYLGKTNVAAEAQRIDLIDAAGGTPWISANLAAGGTVRGVVRTTAGKAVPKYTVTAYAADGSPLATALSSATGAYAFPSLEPGAYRLGAADAISATPSYAPVFTGPAATLGQATEVSVAPGAIVTQNFALGTAGRISGVIRGDCPDATCPIGSTTEPMAGVTVTPYRVSLITGQYVSERLAPRVTNATGAFALTGLAPGRYALRLSPNGAAGASGTHYGERYVGGADSSTSATAFTIASGTVITGANDTLLPSSTITATFVDDAGSGESRANIRVRMSLLSDLERRVISEGFTDSTGTVVLSGAATGSYRLSFGSHPDSNPADGVTENTAWQAGERIVFSYAGSPVIANDTALTIKDPLGLHPLSTLSIATSDPSVGGLASITGGISAWNSSSVTVGVQWLRNGVVVPGETYSYYTFRAADAGAIISARITGRNLAYGSGSVLTDPIPFIGFGTLAQSKSATLAGAAVVGGTLTVTPAEYYVAGTVSTVEWMRVSASSGSQLIAGETGRSHVVTAADLGHDSAGSSTLSALVTVTRQGFTKSTYTVDSDVLIEGSFVQAKAATVTATATTFTAKAPVLAPLPATAEFTWTVYNANGLPEATSTGPTLSRSGKAGKKIMVAIRTARPGYGTRVVNLVAQNGPAPTASGPLAITGTPMVDSPLTAPAVVFAPELDKAPGYQWSYYVTKKKKWQNVGGATQATFTPTAAYRGLRLRVVLSGASTGFLTRSVTSTMTAPVATSSGLGLITAPVVSGVVGFNNTITVSTGTWSPSPSSYGYQWKVSTNGTTFVPIAGATKASYAIPANAFGKTYSVTVTAARAGYASISTTVQTLEVFKGTIKNLTPPKFAEVSPGHWMVTSNGTWSHPALSYTYMWVQPEPVTGVMSVNNVFFNSASNGQVAFDTSAENSTMWGLIVRAQGPGLVYGDAAPLLVRKGRLDSTGAFIADGGDGVEVGEKVSVYPVGWKGVGATTSAYQWQSSPSTDSVPPESTWVNIAGATKATLTTTVPMMNQQLRVRVTGQATGYYGTTISSNPKVVFPANGTIPTGADADAILGTRTVGSVLTYKPAKYPAGWKVAHEWWSNGTGAWLKMGTGPTYVPALPGTVRVQVTATRPGFTTLSYDTFPAVVGLGVITPTIQPKVSKSAAGEYTVTAGSYAPAATTIGYRWTVTSATGVEMNVYTGGASYTPPAIHDGSLLLVELTVASGNPLYPAIKIVKVARAATATIEWSSEPYLNGGYHVGQTLAFAGGTWTMPNPTLSYQWKRSGTVIPGATSESYTAVPADIGKTLTLTVTASRANLGSAVKVLSAASVTLSNVVILPIADPTVTGAPVVGSALVATPGVWNTPGLTVGYQWTRNSAAISGATSSSYTATAADLGQDVGVRVTAGKAGYYVPATSKSSGMHISVGTFASAGTVVIATPKAQFHVGTPIAATLAGWAKNATLTYQWEHSPDGTTFAAILGATGKTFTATPATAGYTRLTITATAPGYTSQVASTEVFRINP